MVNADSASKGGVMRKVVLVTLALFASTAMVTAANANVLLNPGFESGSANWTVGNSAVVVTGDPSRAYNGTSYGKVDLNLSGYFFQSFTLPVGTNTI
jgi:hypothetical protein